MGAFVNNSITERGLLGATKAIGGGQIVFTKIVMGDGQLSQDQDVRKLEGLVHQRVTVGITRNKINTSNTVIIGGTFINSDTSSGFYWRELGLYAKDKAMDEEEYSEEYLYSYANSGDFAEFIPQSGGQTLIEKNIDIVTYVGAATNVNVYIFPDAYVTYADFNDLKKLVLEVKISADDALKVAKQAKMTADEALALIKAHLTDFELLKSQVKTLNDAVFMEIIANPFSITFSDLSGITLNSGVWNKERMRLEC